MNKPGTKGAGYRLAFKWRMGNVQSGGSEEFYKIKPLKMSKLKFHFFKQGIIALLLFTFSISSYGSNKEYLVAPIANFTASATTTCQDSIVTFTDQSTNTPTSWAWAFSPAEVTFRNGTNANSQNPQVSFDIIKTYNVTLTATNVDGFNAITKKSM